MTGFCFQISPQPDGFTVSATADRLPVMVTLREWAWRVAREHGHGDDVGLIRTRYLVDKIAENMSAGMYGNERAANVRVKYGTVPRTARSIHHRVLGEVKRLLDLVPDEVLATQRAVFAATFGTGCSDWPELYRPEYAMLRRDIRQYRAAAAALADGRELVWRAARNEVEATPEYAAVRAAAERGGLEVSLGSRAWTTADGPRRERVTVLDRLAADWRGVFSLDARPYGSLNRTLMNLPGGVPAGMLRHLAGIPLERPVTDRVELVALLAAHKHGCEHSEARKHLRVFLHAGRPQILRALDLVAAATRTPASPRRSADICRAVAYVCDFPEEHRGNVAGLARKAVRWHREAAQQEAAAVVEQLGDQPTALPPIALPDLPGVMFLDSVARVAEEGAVMGHCAAAYASDAVAGACYLFHIDRGGQMATVEVSPQGQVRQAQGPRNQLNAAAGWGHRVLAQWGRGLAAAVPAVPDGADPWGPEPPEIRNERPL